jgi:O-antigen biosynthesis protein WbqV
MDRALQERLLGRPVTDVLTAADVRAFRGRRVLVTGGGGSIGSELALQMANAGVARLAVMDHSEYALFRVETELRQACPDVPVVPWLGDVTRGGDVRDAFNAAEPEVVYHAAAYKHVTYAERAAVQALRVNALGALEVARAARAAGARFVLISSDKAAQPCSVMGATKRFAERLVLAEAGGSYRPLVVRFGNVLGSSGSVAEILLRRAQAGLPLPVTDPDATRYFMTAGEAVSLVLKADLIGRQSGIFWLDMGAPIRIGDLAGRILAHVQAMGLAPVEIAIIGLRPGEKRHEELTSQGAALVATDHPRILSARQPGVDAALVRAGLRGARRACAAGDPAAALAVLRQHVEDYVPSGTAVDRAAQGAGGRAQVRAA